MKTSKAMAMIVMNQLQCHPFTLWVTFACIEYFAMVFFTDRILSMTNQVV